MRAKLGVSVWALFFWSRFQIGTKLAREGYGDGSASTKHTRSQRRLSPAPLPGFPP